MRRQARIAAGEHLRVRLTREGVAEDLDVEWVVACVGPQYDVHRWDDPLTVSMLDADVARPHPLGVGFDCGPDGALCGAAGASPRLFTLGSPRRGDLWETTGIKEIAEQAERLAEILVPGA